MYTQRNFEDLLKTQKSIAPLGEWNKKLMDIYRHTAQQNLELWGDQFSRISEILKRGSQLEKPEEFLNFQKDVINENMSATVDYFHKLMHIYTENLEEYSKLYGSLKQTATDFTENVQRDASKMMHKAKRKVEKEVEKETR